MGLELEDNFVRKLCPCDILWHVDVSHGVGPCSIKDAIGSVGRLRAVVNGELKSDGSGMDMLE